MHISVFHKNKGLFHHIPVVDGKDSCAIDVMQDRHDAWGMTFREWRDKIGSFTLLSDEEGTAFSDQDATIPSIRVIEDGDVRTVVEAVYGYEGSRARVHYKLSKQASVIDVDIRIVNQEKRKMFKLGLTPADPNAAPTLEAEGQSMATSGGFQGTSLPSLGTCSNGR